MTDIRSQLAPGWSGVNIALVVVGFLIGWPLGILMLVYIVFGEQLNINLADPTSLRAFGSRIALAWQAACTSWKSTANKHSHERTSTFNSDFDRGTPRRD